MNAPTTDAPPFRWSDFTLDQIVDAATAEVREAGPDFIYRKRPTDYGSACLYVHDGRPDCLIGRMAHRLGAPLALLARWGPDSIRGVLATEPVDPARGVWAFLDALQVTQDGQRPWGVALGWGLAALERSGAVVDPATLAAAQVLVPEGVDFR